LTEIIVGIMKKLLLSIFVFFIIIININANDISWGENFYSYSSKAIATGTTFTRDISSAYITPSIIDKGGLYFSTSLLKKDIKNYYLSYRYKSFIFDIFYYDWGSFDYRNEYGEDLGTYYAQNSSFSISYQFRYKNFSFAPQLRYNLKEIGNIKKTKLFIIPSASYSFKKYNIETGFTVQNIYNQNFSTFIIYSKNSYDLKIRNDYFNKKFTNNFGFNYYFNKEKNYSIGIGLSDNNFTTGFGIQNNGLYFDYGLKIENGDIFINSFSLKIDM